MEFPGSLPTKQLIMESATAEQNVVAKLPTWLSAHALVSTGSGSRHHLQELDGLRGFAILLVLCSHLVSLPPGGRSPFVDRLVGMILGLGWVGVDLFFVLSGFLITGILVQSRGGPHYFRNFYARRSLRIFPLYYLFLAIATFISPLLLSPESILTLPKEHAWVYWLYLSNFGGKPSEAFAHTWSLAVEEQFYLVWPAIVFFAKPVAMRRVCVSLSTLR